MATLSNGYVIIPEAQVKEAIDFINTIDSNLGDIIRLKLGLPEELISKGGNNENKTESR